MNHPPSFDLSASGQAALPCCNLGYNLGGPNRLGNREPSQRNPECYEPMQCNCSTSLPEVSRNRCWYVWGSEVPKNLTLPFLIQEVWGALWECNLGHLPESTLKASGISGSQFAWYPKPLWPFGLQSAYIKPIFMSRTQWKQEKWYMCHASSTNNRDTGRSV